MCDYDKFVYVNVIKFSLVDIVNFNEKLKIVFVEKY